MTVSLSQLLEDSFQIAWEYLERSGELGDGASASRFLSDVIETMIRRGQRSRLALSNRAISAYQRFRSSVPQDQNGRVLPPVVSAIPARNTRITGTILGSWPSEVRIPIYSGRVFRREAGHRSDLKPATIPK